MEIPEPNTSPPPDLNAAMCGVRRGRELTSRLVALLRRSAVQYGGLEEAGCLAEEALASISSALSALDSAAEGGSPLCSDRVGSEGSIGKRKVRPAGERRRGQSLRSQPYAWTKVVANKLDDGHTWRKYGQKEIHGAKHPRCYFRCTHKYDQGCQAARHVQKSEDDPTMFVITYLRQHTCKKPMTSFWPGGGPDAVEPLLISFEPPERLDGGARSDPRLPAPFPAPMQETEDDTLSSQLSRNDSSFSPEYQMLPELTPLEASAPMTGISSAASDAAGDVTSGFLGVDFAGESFRLEDILGLEHNDFAFVY